MKIASGHTAWPSGLYSGLRSATAAKLRKRSATQHGSPSYSAKFTLLSQKQRRNAYDSDVYAKIFFNDLSGKIMVMNLRFVKFNCINDLFCEDNREYSSFCELQQIREMNVTSYAVNRPR